MRQGGRDQRKEEENSLSLVCPEREREREGGRGGSLTLFQGPHTLHRGRGRHTVLSQ